MIIDLVCLTFALIYAFFGWFTGGMLQLVKLAALVLAYFGARWLEPVAMGMLEDLFGLRVEALSFFVMLAAWFILYLAIGWLGKLLVRGLRSASETITGWDRVLGVLVALIKAALIIVLLGYLVGKVRPYIYRAHPDAMFEMHDSYVLRFLAANDILLEEKLPERVSNMAQMLEILADERKRKTFMESEQTRELLEKPALRGVLSDSELMKKIRAGEMLDVMKDPRIRDLLEDEDIQQMLKDIEQAKQPKKD